MLFNVISGHSRDARPPRSIRERRIFTLFSIAVKDCCRIPSSHPTHCSISSRVAVLLPLGTCQVGIGIFFEFRISRDFLEEFCPRRPLSFLLPRFSAGNARPFPCEEMIPPTIKSVNGSTDGDQVFGFSKKHLTNGQMFKCPQNGGPDQKGIDVGLEFTFDFSFLDYPES